MVLIENGFSMKKLIGYCPGALYRESILVHGVNVFPNIRQAYVELRASW